VTASIEVVLLGTGSPLPDPNRAGPATLVSAGGTNLLVDCGRRVLLRAAEHFDGVIDLADDLLRVTVG
jgi:ribonuclease Z